MRKILTISFSLLLMLTIAQGAWGQTASKYHVGRIVGTQPQGWLQTMMQRQHDGDERIPAALERHYLNFTVDDLAGGIVGGRNIMSIEGILWTYVADGRRWWCCGCSLRAQQGNV